MRTRHSLMAITLLGFFAAGGWVYTQQKTSPGTAVLTGLDYAEIQQLYVRYAHAINAGNGEAYAAVFTADGGFHSLQPADGSLRHIVGHKALVEFANQGTMRKMRAWPAPPVVTPTAEGASGSAYFLNLDVSGKQPVVTFSGIYEDAFVKTTDGWRIKSRTFRRDAPPPAAQ